MTNCPKSSRRAEQPSACSQEQASMTLTSNSPEQTVRIGAMIGQVCQPGDAFALCGPLGAGKTQLVKGIAEGLEVSDPAGVTSPTFVLAQRYQGRLHLWHVDAYRLSSADQMWDIGFDEMCASGGVVVVEWADHVAEAIPEDTLWVQLVPTGPQSRQIGLTRAGTTSRRLLEGLGRKVDAGGQ